MLPREMEALDRLLPTTMVGSYPRPGWFRDQLAGRDILEAFKVIHHREAFGDAVKVVIDDQTRAGLDILTDGQMWFDDYSMGIGSFLFYWLERIEGFGKEKLPHPARAKAQGRDEWALDEVGGIALVGEPRRGPIRMAQLFHTAQSCTERPIKACIGAGPVQLSTLVHFKGGPVKDRYELAHRLAEIFREEIGEVVAAGCRHIQLEDLGAWIPTLTGDKDFAWVRDVVNATLAGCQARTSWHFCLGNVWGNKMQGLTRAGYAEVLPHYYDVDVQEYVLDFACREMSDAALLAEIPKDKRVAVGVIDVRTLEIEPPEHVAERIRKVLAHIEPERVTVTTDCGMKQLPRHCAAQKLRSLAGGAAIVRAELEGR
jgi:5-methyltetrahydropteroyltriglutamate--homocysteine methyltransferase